jgi:hypothetical protein
LRKDRTRAQYAEVVAGFEKKSSQIAAMLHEKLPAIMSARAEETWRAVVGDHQPRRAKLRDLKEPTPNEARIRTAAALQAKDIVDIVIARLPKPRRR